MPSQRSPPRALVLALGCLVAQLPAAAAAQPGEPVRVGAYDFVPLVAISGPSGVRGLYVDLLEHVASREGWDLEYVPGTWDECLRRLEAGEIDLLPVIGYSEERAKRLAYNSEYPVVDWGVVYARRPSGIETIFDLRGKRIAALRGSIYTHGFRTLLDQFGLEAAIVEKDDYRAVFRAIQDGEVDAGINAQIYGALLGDEYGSEPTPVVFSPVKLGYAVLKGRGREHLLRALDTRFAALKREPGSAWYELRERWLGAGRRAQTLPRWIFPALALTAAATLLGFAFAFTLRRQVAARTLELTRANLRLKESEGRYRGFSELTSDLLTEFRVVPGREPVLVWSAGRLEDHSSDGLPLEDVPGADEMAREAKARRLQLAGSGEGHVHEYRLSRKGGEERWFNESGRAERDEAGRVSRILLATRDVTHRKRLEAQLLLAQKMEAIGRLAGGMAHDLNNLLTPILANGNLLRVEFAPGDERHELAEEIERAALRAKDLVRQLLAFGRKQALQTRPVDLNAVVSGFESLVRRTLREDITVEMVLAPSLPAAMADVLQIEQVIMNLVVNGQDAMPGGGRLVIETREVVLDEGYARAHRDVSPGKYVMLAVSDTGHGMDLETMDRIFDPFFTTKEKGKGTGLGLATVYGIVRQHGGHIWVYSEPGKGATFKIYFPAAGGPAAAPPAVRVHPGAPRGSETVMVVEDNEMVRAMAVRGLTRLGYRVLSSGGGRECLEVLGGHAGPLDLLLTDVVMPEMNGRALFEKVTARFPSVAVLYMSGYTDNVVLHHGVVEEGIRFIQKPFTEDALGAKVREVLSGADGPRLGPGSPPARR